MGKAIYMPKGKAAEYAKYACGFYNSCSNNCTYCYLKKGVLSKTMGGNIPTLKKCFKDEAHALEVFEKELKASLPELQKHGLFFSFTTDPMLRETIEMTFRSTAIAIRNNVPCKILTKCAYFYEWDMTVYLADNIAKNLIALGFTLTGHDELEPNASTNAERIEAMRKLHEAGFKTWASIEPVIDFESSYEMIVKTLKICDLYKIGLMSGKKYETKGILRFIELITKYLPDVYKDELIEFPKIYFKDSLLSQAGINREDLPVNCVNRDYNMYN